MGSAIGGLLGGGDAKQYTGYDIDKKDYNNEAQNAATQDKLSSALTASQNRTAPTMGAAQVGNTALVQTAGIDPSKLYGQASTVGPANIDRQDDQFRQGQSSLSQALATQAAGGGPSLAAGQLQQANDRTIAAQMAAAASARGGSNPALMGRQLATQGIEATQQAGQQAAQMKMQEQLNAQQALASTLANARNQDIGVNTSQAQLNQQGGITNANLGQGMTLANMQAAQGQQQLGMQSNIANAAALNNTYAQNAGFGQQANANNLNAGIQTQAQKDALAQYYNTASMGLDENTRQALMKYNQDQVGQTNDLNQLNFKSDQAAAQANAQLMSGLISGAGTIGLGMMTGGASAALPAVMGAMKGK